MKRPPFYEIEMGQCHCGCGRYLMWRSGPDTPWYVKAAMFVGWWNHGRKATPRTTQAHNEIKPDLEQRTSRSQLDYAVEIAVEDYRTPLPPATPDDDGLWVLLTVEEAQALATCDCELVDEDAWRRGQHKLLTAGKASPSKANL